MRDPIVIGHGPNRVLVLHGWFGSATAWQPIHHALDTEQFSYAFLDYRGYGKRKHEKGCYTLDEIAADTLAAANVLGWEKFSLIGHSMGGKAIQRILLKAPARVEKLVGVTPVPAAGVHFDAQTRAFFESASADPEARAGIINQSSGSRLSQAWIKRMVTHSIENSTPEAFSAYLGAWADGDFSEELRGNQVPVLLVIGENDPSLTLDVMKGTWLSLYPNARMVALTNAGHYPMDETPVILVTEIEKFLSQ